MNGGGGGSIPGGYPPNSPQQGMNPQNPQYQGMQPQNSQVTS